MTTDPYLPYLRQADELFAHGEIVKAGQIWQAILKQHPSHTEARVGLMAVKERLLALREAENTATSLPPLAPRPRPPDPPGSLSPSPRYPPSSFPLRRPRGSPPHELGRGGFRAPSACCPDPGTCPGAEPEPPVPPVLDPRSTAPEAPLPMEPAATDTAPEAPLPIDPAEVITGSITFDPQHLLAQEPESEPPVPPVLDPSATAPEAPLAVDPAEVITGSITFPEHLMAQASGPGSQVLPRRRSPLHRSRGTPAHRSGGGGHGRPHLQPRAPPGRGLHPLRHGSDCGCLAEVGTGPGAGSRPCPCPGLHQRRPPGVGPAAPPDSRHPGARQGGTSPRRRGRRETPAGGGPALRHGAGGRGHLEMGARPRRGTPTA